MNVHAFIEDGLGKLFAAEDRRLDRSICRIHASNQEMLRTRLDGFMYLGVYYKPADAINGPGLRRTLHLDLWPEMDDHLSDQKTVTLDRSLIKQTLFKLIEPCEFIGPFKQIWQNVRDAIPECILDVFPAHVTELSRINIEGWTLNHPRDFRQFTHAVPKMEFYSASRLLY